MYCCSGGGDVGKGGAVVTFDLLSQLHVLVLVSVGCRFELIRTQWPLILTDGKENLCIGQESGARWS